MEHDFEGDLLDYFVLSKFVGDHLSNNAISLRSTGIQSDAEKKLMLRYDQDATPHLAENFSRHSSSQTGAENL